MATGLIEILFFFFLVDSIKQVFFRLSKMSDESSADWSNIKSVHGEHFLDTKKSKFDLNNLHPEAQKRLQMLGFIKTTDNGQHEEATDEEIDKILRKTVQKQDPNVLADEYMMKHGLYELFKVIQLNVKKRKLILFRFRQ